MSKLTILTPWIVTSVAIIAEAAIFVRRRRAKAWRDEAIPYSPCVIARNEVTKQSLGLKGRSHRMVGCIPAAVRDCHGFLRKPRNDSLKSGEIATASYRGLAMTIRAKQASQ